MNIDVSQSSKSVPWPAIHGDRDGLGTARITGKSQLFVILDRLQILIIGNNSVQYELVVQNAFNLPRCTVLLGNDASV
jgi:hypothetical protein